MKCAIRDLTSQLLGLENTIFKVLCIYTALITYKVVFLPSLAVEED